jgi:FkbM family methyltransferase
MPIFSIFSRLRQRWQYFQSLPSFRTHPLRTLVRALHWRLRCALGWAVTVDMPAWQAKVWLAPEWHGAGMTLFYVVRESYELELEHLGKLIRPGDTVVDAGANCGLYTLAAAHFAGPNGRVLAFEPGRLILPVLEKNVALNRLKHVQIFPLALAESPRRGQLFSHPHGASSFTLGHAPDEAPESVEIEVDTLDAVLARERLDRVDLIKMDVEGAEELILRGSEELFRRRRPTVLFEINPTAIANLRLKRDGVWAILAPLGYSFHQFDASGNLLPVEVCPPGGCNLIALPPGQSIAREESRA